MRSCCGAESCFGGLLISITILLISLLVGINCEANDTNIYSTSSSYSVSSSKKINPYVKVKGTRFVLNNKPYFFNGFNSYWLLSTAAEASTRPWVSTVFREAASAGLTVCRTWAFLDGGYGSLQIFPSIYNETVFKGFDFVISEAKKYKIRLVLCLANSHKDYGGRNQYVNWAQSAGLLVNGTVDDFYTHPDLKRYYKNHVQRVLTRNNTITGVRYKDDPIIMSWELLNEPRCEVDLSGRTVNGWIQEMAAYVKSIDKKHLLTVGMEGFYGESFPDRIQYNPGYLAGTDFITNHLFKEIDFATIHAYPDLWLPGQNDSKEWDYMHKWMISHWTDSMVVLQKPLIFAEFGKTRKEAGFTIGARDAFLYNVYETIHNFARAGAFGGGLIWELVAPGTEQHFNDGYEIVLSKTHTTSNIISHNSRQMRALQEQVKLGG